MTDECNYSFWDLFEASNKRRPTKREKEEFNLLIQEEKNRLIKKWANTANWGVNDRIGSGGKIYTAFCPLWKTNTKKSKLT